MLENKKIFILGMARSGYEVAKLLASKNEILLTDKIKGDEDKTEELINLGVDVVFTNDQEELLDNSFDILIRNPGVPYNNPTIKKAQKLNIPIYNEIDIAYKYLDDVKIIGITGSNGKTTTTTLIYDIFKKAGLDVFLAGNIGYPLSSIVKDVKKGSILVMEISDHQLIDMKDFKTNVSVLTNLSEVHLDFHGSYEKYMKVKKKIFDHQTEKDYAIINKGNLDSVNLTKNIQARKIYFSSYVDCDCYLKDDYICYKDEKIINTSDIRIKGKHNYENIMCAIIVSKLFNIENEIITSVLEDFNGVEHRIEYVKKVNDRVFYNDSKATNVKSTEIALSSFDSPTILIMGGLDRGHSFEELKDYLKNVKNIVCYGETKYRIKEFCDKYMIDVIVLDTLEEAVKAAYNISSKGDVILLSPACASWDQYSSFEERGEEFKKLVEVL